MIGQASPSTDQRRLTAAIRPLVAYATNGRQFLRSLVWASQIALCLAAGAEPTRQALPTDSPLKSGRIVFLGDSITYSGQYVDDLSLVLRNLGHTNLDFLNLGLPSETVSGLSEPGHANGSFPRPNLHERLERLLEMTKPDAVLACYGMNDGIYYPFDMEKFEKYQAGIRLLRDRVLRAKAKIILVTPPVFDPVPIKNRTLPAGLDEYRQPFAGYNNVLDRYAQWLIDQRTNGWAVIDVHFIMNDFLRQQRSRDPGYTLASDGVHLNDTGQWLMAQAILQGLKVPVQISNITLDLVAGNSTVAGETKDIQKRDREVSFNWRTRPPFPLRGLGLESTGPPGATEVVLHPGEIHSIFARHPEFAEYTLLEGDTNLGVIQRKELESGIDTRQFARLITTERGVEILRLVHKKNRVLSDAWLTAVGHKRPGMTKGIPIDQATAQASELDRQIEELNRPVELQLTLKAQGRLRLSNDR